MAVSAGEIGLDLVINKKQYDKQLKGITSMAKKAGVALAAAFTVKKIVDFGKECIELGSDLAEVQNVVDVTFPHMTAQVDKFAQSAATSFGLSETMAKKFTGTFGAMAKAFGFSESAAYDMSTTLTGLAGDVASFYNISQDEAYTKLKSVFTGETESLKDLGVVMTQSALDAYALANGYGKTTSAMSEAEKVALRYAFVQNQLSAATGDFARTSDSWANQVRILSLQFDSLKATIGQGLINVFTPVIKVINTIIGKLQTLANAFKAFTELLTGKKSTGAQVASTGAAAEDSLSSAAGAADSLSNATSGVGNAAKKAAKEMKALMGFDHINKLDDTSDSDSGSSGGSSGGAGGASVDFGSGVLSEMDSATNEFSSKMEGYFNKIQKAIEPTVTSLKRLWNEGLARLGDFTWTALQGFYEGFLAPVGSWVLGTGLPRFIDALNDGLMNVDFDKINKSLDRLWDALAPFAINIGDGLLWFWENVLVPLGTWTANEVVPRFLDTMSIAIETANGIIEALKPTFQWFWDNVLKPLASWVAGTFLDAWDGINSALTTFSDWCSKNPEVVKGITVAVLAFFAAWKGIELLSFIQTSGGVIAALKKITIALFGTTAAKIKDKAATIASTLINAKDFVVSLASSTKALISQAKQFAINTAAKYADEAAMNGVSVATVLWNSLLSTSIGKMALSAAAWVKETAAKVASTAAQVAQTAATVAWNAVCALATVATTALGAAFAFLTSPIGLVVLAIAALIAVGVLIYKNWDTIKEKAIELWQGICDTFSGIADWFGQKFAEAREAIYAAIIVIKAWFQKRYDEVTSVFAGIGDWFGKIFKGAWNAICNAFSGVGSFFSGLWDKIVGCFTDAGTKIGDAVHGAFCSAVNGVFQTIENIVNGFIKTINGAISVINKIPGVSISKLKEVSLPRLAQGGYVKANTPQLAMIGDNRHQGEVVAPEDKLKEMALEAVKMAGGSGTGITKEELERIINNAVLHIVSALYELGFNIDGEQLAKAEKMIKQGMDRRFNTAEIV